MSRPRILVIDDDPQFRSLMTAMLRKDYLVTVAADGAEGYHKAIEHAPHLAIIDVQMTGWDGLRPLRALRSCPALAKMPVMMLTGDASRQTVLATVQAGANDYLIKMTLSRDELLKKVRRLLSLDAGHRGKTAELPVGNATGHGADGETAAVRAIVDSWE